MEIKLQKFGKEVEVILSKTIADINGNQVEIWDVDNKRNYNHDDVNAEKGKNKKKLAELNKMDIVKEKKGLEDKLSVLDQIQVELDKK